MKRIEKPTPPWKHKDSSQTMYFFDNGYCASVICSFMSYDGVRHGMSYGADEGLYEIGFGAGKEHTWKLIDSPLDPEEGQTRGWLTQEDVDRLVDELEKLPKRSPKATPITNKEKSE